jgi:hypothetical protein
MRTYHRDRYQLAQVERMVENAYDNYLVSECNSQKKYKRKLLAQAEKKPTSEEKAKANRIAAEFELSRCVELNSKTFILSLRLFLLVYSLFLIRERDINFIAVP